MPQKSLKGQTKIQMSKSLKHMNADLASRNFQMQGEVEEEFDCSVGLFRNSTRSVLKYICDPQFLFLVVCSLDYKM